MTRTRLKEILFYRFHPVFSYTVLILFSFWLVGTGLFFFLNSPVAMAQYLQPFEGRITNVDYYSCVCGGSILLSIEPTTESTQGQPTEMLFFYAGQALADLGLDLSISGIALYPQLFAFKNIWYAGPQRLLGLYIPTPLPCVAYAGTSCTIEGYYPAIHMVGTSLY